MKNLKQESYIHIILNFGLHNEAHIGQEFVLHGSVTVLNKDSINSPVTLNIQNMYFNIKINKFQ